MYIDPLIKYPVMFRSTQRFYVDGPYLQVNFRVQSNLERLGKVLFYKMYLLFLFSCFIYALYMFYKLCSISCYIYALYLFNDE